MCLYSKQSSLFSFYALPSGGKCGGSLDASNNIYAFSLNGLFECASLYCKTGQKIDKRQIGRGWPKFLKTVSSGTLNLLPIRTFLLIILSHKIISGLFHFPDSDRPKIYKKLNQFFFLKGQSSRETQMRSMVQLVFPAGSRSDICLLLGFDSSQKYSSFCTFKFSANF